MSVQWNIVMNYQNVLNKPAQEMEVATSAVL